MIGFQEFERFKGYEDKCVQFEESLSKFRSAILSGEEGLDNQINGIDVATKAAKLGLYTKVGDKPEAYTEPLLKEMKSLFSTSRQATYAEKASDVEGGIYEELMKMRVVAL